MALLTTVRPLDGPPRLIAAGPADLEALEKLRRGQHLATRITFPRSLPHLRWFHGLLDIVARGIGRPAGWLKVELKIRAGLYLDVHRSPIYGTVAVLESLAMYGEKATMDETRFNEFRQIAIELIFTEADMLPGVNRRDVYKEVEDWLGEKCPW